MAMSLLGFSILIELTGNIGLQAMETEASKFDLGGPLQILRPEPPISYLESKHRDTDVYDRFLQHQRNLTPLAKIEKMRNALAFDDAGENIDGKDFIRMFGIRVLNTDEGENQEMFENFKKILKKKNNDYELKSKIIAEELKDLVDEMFETFQTKFVDTFKQEIKKLSQVSIDSVGGTKNFTQIIAEVSSNLQEIGVKFESLLKGKKHNEAKELFLTNLLGFMMLFQTLAGKDVIKNNHALFFNLLINQINNTAAEKLASVYNSILVKFDRVQNHQANVTDEEKRVASIVSGIAKKAEKSKNAKDDEKGVESGQTSDTSNGKETTEKLFEELAQAVKEANIKTSEITGHATPNQQQLRKNALESLEAFNDLMVLINPTTGEEDDGKPKAETVAENVLTEGEKAILKQYSDLLNRAEKRQNRELTETEKFLTEWFDNNTITSQPANNSAAVVTPVASRKQSTLRVRRKTSKNSRRGRNPRRRAAKRNKMLAKRKKKTKKN